MKNEVYLAVKYLHEQMGCLFGEADVPPPPRPDYEVFQASTRKDGCGGKCYDASQVFDVFFDTKKYLYEHVCAPGSSCQCPGGICEAIWEEKNKSYTRLTPVRNPSTKRDVTKIKIPIHSQRVLHRSATKMGDDSSTLMEMDDGERLPTLSSNSTGFAAIPPTTTDVNDVDRISIEDTDSTEHFSSTMTGVDSSTLMDVASGDSTEHAVHEDTKDEDDDESALPMSTPLSFGKHDPILFISIGYLPEDTTTDFDGVQHCRIVKSLFEKHALGEIVHLHFSFPGDTKKTFDVRRSEMMKEIQNAILARQYSMLVFFSSTHGRITPSQKKLLKLGKGKKSTGAHMSQMFMALHSYREKHTIHHGIIDFIEDNYRSFRQSTGMKSSCRYKRLYLVGACQTRGSDPPDQNILKFGVQSYDGNRSDNWNNPFEPHNWKNDEDVADYCKVCAALPGTAAFASHFGDLTTTPFIEGIKFALDRFREGYTTVHDFAIKLKEGVETSEERNTLQGAQISCKHVSTHARSLKDAMPLRQKNLLDLESSGSSINHAIKRIEISASKCEENDDDDMETTE